MDSVNRELVSAFKTEPTSCSRLRFSRSDFFFLLLPSSSQKMTELKVALLLCDSDAFQRPICEKFCLGFKLFHHGGGVLVGGSLFILSSCLYY